MTAVWTLFAGVALGNLLGRLTKRRPKPPPPITDRRVTVSAELVPLVAGSGWLSPRGTFHTAPACKGHHRQAAKNILDPEGPMDPHRDYEWELEDMGYVKLMNVSAGAWTGWYKGKRRMTRTQRDIIAGWYLERGRKLPDWLNEQF